MKLNTLAKKLLNNHSNAYFISNWKKLWNDQMHTPRPKLWNEAV